MLRDCFASDALVGVYRGVARFSHVKRAAESIGDYLAEFDLLVREAGLHAQVGGAFLAASVSAACPQIAPLPGRKNSWCRPVRRGI